MEAGRGESEEGSVKIGKTTTTSYAIRHSSDGYSVVLIDFSTDTGELTRLWVQVSGTTAEHLNMLRQALQFIDGEAHKHRTAQETA